MAVGRQKSVLGTWVKRIIIICLIIVVGKMAKDFIMPEMTDVTNMVNMDTETLERALEISLERDTDMAQKVNHYSKDEISTDSADGIGVVYMGGRQVGLHIDSRNYGMFGLQVGDAEVNVERRITYEYERKSGVVTDNMQGPSNVTLYVNFQKNDCLIVICNNYSNRIVAITYFNDMKKMTEQLSRVW